MRRLIWRGSCECGRVPSGLRPRIESVVMSSALMVRTDEELVARSVRGDHDSFNQLVVRWERQIYALASRVLGHQDEARDVCQETFLRAFRSIKGFRGQAKFSSWLYQITVNLCRDWSRRERRSPLVPVPEGVDVPDLAAVEIPSDSVEDLVGWRELGDEVSLAMAAIPREQRTAIVLKEYHGFTFQEIADSQGCPLSTVKTRLYKGLTHLRQELERRGIDRAAVFPSRGLPTATQQESRKAT